MWIGFRITTRFSSEIQGMTSCDTGRHNRHPPVFHIVRRGFTKDLIGLLPDNICVLTCSMSPWSRFVQQAKRSSVTETYPD